MSDLHVPPKRRGSSSFWRLYMFSWTALAGAALVYMTIFALNPDVGGKFLPQPSTSNDEPSRAALDRDQLNAEVRTLSETVASLRDDLARVRSAQTETGQRNAATDNTTRPNASEPAFNADQDAAGTSPITTSSLRSSDETPQTPAAVEPPSEQATVPAAPAYRGPQNGRENAHSKNNGKENVQAQPRRRPGRNLATSPLRAGRVPPVPSVFPEQTNRPEQAAATSPAQRVANVAGQPLLLNGTGATTTAPVKPSAPPAANPIASNSVAAPSFGEAKVKPKPVAAPPAAALALSTATSVTGLKASWLMLTSRHPDAFIGYQPRYIVDQSTGSFRLVAGPLPNRSEADRVCTDLRSRRISCGVTEYAGQPL